MAKGRRGFRKWVFGAGMAAALGFGGAQAMAAPAPDARDEVRKCNPTGCNASCQARGGFSGRCTDAGLCACLF
jgi:hypothetical protein